MRARARLNRITNPTCECSQALYHRLRSTRSPFLTIIPLALIHVTYTTARTTSRLRPTFLRSSSKFAWSIDGWHDTWSPYSIDLETGSGDQARMSTFNILGRTEERKEVYTWFAFEMSYSEEICSPATRETGRDDTSIRTGNLRCFIMQFVSHPSHLQFNGVENQSSVNACKCI
jgi:hypothetical protein